MRFNVFDLAAGQDYLLLYTSTTLSEANIVGVVTGSQTQDVLVPNYEASIIFLTDGNSTGNGKFDITWTADIGM